MVFSYYRMRWSTFNYYYHNGNYHTMVVINIHCYHSIIHKQKNKNIYDYHATHLVGDCSFFPLWYITGQKHMRVKGECTHFLWFHARLKMRSSLSWSKQSRTSPSVGGESAANFSVPIQRVSVAALSSCEPAEPGRDYQGGAGGDPWPVTHPLPPPNRVERA
jgi:hypothetical protein